MNAACLSSAAPDFSYLQNNKVTHLLILDKTRRRREKGKFEGIGASVNGENRCERDFHLTVVNFFGRFKLFVCTGGMANGGGAGAVTIFCGGLIRFAACSRRGFFKHPSVPVR